MLQDNPNKPTNNGYEILERLIGIPKTEQMKIMEEIRHNRQLLDGCSRHDFSEEIKQPHRALSKWKCVNCGGIVDYSEKLWYEKGIEHASQGG